MQPNFPVQLSKGLESSHLPAIDGIRAIAAMLVVLYHAGIEGCPGGLGVLAFFVLSGFLITWLLLKEENRTGTVSLKFFYIRRSLRIFPAFYIFCFLWIGMLLATGRAVHWPQTIAALLYVNNYYQALNGDPDTGLSHTWSLGIEEQFYLLWPLAFLLVRSWRGRLWLLSGSIVSVWIYREILVLVFNRDSGYLYEAFDTRADHLLIGCLLAVLLRQRALPGVWRAVCASPYFIWVTVGLLSLSVAVANTVTWRYRDMVGFIADPLLVAVFIVQTIAAKDLIFGTILNWGWVRYLGSISYSVYLYQQVVMHPVKNITEPWPWVSIPAQVAAAVAVASVSYFAIEMPFLRLKNRFLA